ncbi:MAG: cupredoxin domain-containing protein [Nitriliruptoraceae bacterium]|nr:cupredoxin domain-containing protein [Nitriliruptoraceae bacterium]
MRHTIRTTTVCLALVLAACGGVDDAAPVDEPTAETETRSDTATDAMDDTDSDADDTSDDADAGDAEQTDQVDARNINFEPADIEVTVGTTVTFTNQDIVRHTVTSGPSGEPDGTFDLPLDAQGDEVTFTFDEPGTYDYYCDLHRAMVGTVTVTD